MQVKKKKRILNWTEWVLLGIVTLSTLLIAVSLCADAWKKSPEERAIQEMTKLADEYYLTFLYPQILGNLNNDPAEQFADYAATGIPTVLLRQLLHYDDDKRRASEPIFTAVGCNTNQTGVRFYPVEPYGPHDYTAAYIWHCDNGEFPTS